MSQTFDRYAQTPQPSHAQSGAPAKRGCGCWMLGCLCVMLVMVILALFAVVGVYFYSNQIVQSYTSPTPVQLPQVDPSQVDVSAIEKRIEDFTNQINAGQDSADIELTADELNAIISANPDSKGKAYITIEEDSLRAQVSLPISETGFADGRYFNADATLDMQMVNGKLRITFDDVMVNDKEIPTWLNSALQETDLTESLKNDKDMAELLNRVEDFRIEDGKIILKVRPDLLNDTNENAANEEAGTIDQGNTATREDSR